MPADAAALMVAWRWISDGRNPANLALSGVATLAPRPVDPVPPLVTLLAAAVLALRRSPLRSGGGVRDGARGC